MPCANLVRKQIGTPNVVVVFVCHRARLEGQRQTLDDEAELLVRAVAADLLRHQLTKHRDHRKAAVLQLLQLLLGKDLRETWARI